MTCEIFTFFLTLQLISQLQIFYPILVFVFLLAFSGYNICCQVLSDTLGNPSKVLPRRRYDRSECQEMVQYRRHVSL